MSQDLNSIIDQLAEIDSASAQIMRNTQDEKTRYAEYIQQQKIDFDKKLEKQVDIEITQFEKELSEKSAQELADFQAACQQDILRLDSFYQQKSNSLAEEIFKSIIKE
ncbi:MAG: hypothetical protein HFG28_10535 [Eubacterium sp.]|nr:hypothetical protein [Eubacterium sp.]